jgi:triacylglycerol lipase
VLHIHVAESYSRFRKRRENSLPALASLYPIHAVSIPRTMNLAVTPLRCALLALLLSLTRLHADDDLPSPSAPRSPAEPATTPSTPDASDINVSALSNATTSASAPDTVLLLHGLGLNRLAMARLACALRRDGYRVINVSYPSRSVSLEDLASTWLPDLLRAHKTDTAPRLHVITHSMGGILLRLYLRDQRPANLGRLVMIAPPNHGSEVAEKLRENCFFRLFTGKNGRRLGTGPESLPLTLGPLDADLGIIAGSRSLNPLFSSWIARPSDGKVAIESTKLEGMKDHLILPISHTWLQYRRPVITQVRAYLRDGKFQHPPL